MRGKWLRTGASSVIAVAAVAGLVVAGMDNGNAAREVRLLSGAAWLPSSQVGQVTLLDGSSAEIAAQVQVAPQGDAIDVVQQGSTAYAIDHQAGTIRRIDGATFDPTKPATPIPAARAGLTAFADEKSLYALDSQQGVLVDTDPATLAPRGRPISLAAQLATGGAAMDDAGTLWIVDQATGDLTSVTGSTRATYRGFTKPGTSALTIAGNRPVVVNATDRTVSTADPLTGRPGSVLNLDLRPTDKVAVSGSPHSSRLYVVTSRGVLILCDLGAGSCDATVPLDPSATDLGAAVEAGNRLFVPDYSGGRVWVINLDDRSVLAKPQVLPPGRFQLLTRDGVVFFNDPNSEKAGVIRLDGGVRPAAKYDPKDPAKGLHAPPNTKSPPTSPPHQQQPQKQEQQQPPQTSTPSTDTPQSPTNTGGTPITSSPTPPGGGATPPPAKPRLRITVSKAEPPVDEDVSLKVTNSNGPSPKSAIWDFGDGTKGAGLTVTHEWAAEKTYQVTVTATLPDMRTASTSLSLTVTPPPSVTVPDVIGKSEADAKSAIQALGLNTVVSTVVSNTVPAGVVIGQNPAPGSSAAAGTDVAITVSSGPTSVDLLAAAPGADWVSGAGTLPFNGSDTDNRGFALRRDGEYPLNDGVCRLEDGTAPSYLEMQPEWVDDGYLNGIFTLPAPIIPGDHFRAKIGFIHCTDVRQPQLSGATFSVAVIDGAAVQVAAVSDTDNATMHQLDVDLTPYAGSTKVLLHVSADGDSQQDWASWVNPRIEG